LAKIISKSRQAASEEVGPELSVSLVLLFRRLPETDGKKTVERNTNTNWAEKRFFIDNSHG